MSPDAASGSINDPLTQVPYVFEHNNTIAYSDPTGYASDDRGWDDANLASNGLGPLAGENGLGDIATGEHDLQALEFQDAAQSAISKALQGRDPNNPRVIRLIRKIMRGYGINMAKSEAGLKVSTRGVTLEIYASDKNGGSIQMKMTGANMSQKDRTAFRDQFSNRFWKDSGKLQIGPRAQGAPGTYLPRPLERSFIWSNRNDE